jgi:serine/threonine protein kinase, bacterial
VSDSPWRLGGRFDLLGPLGTGASGAVWLGLELADGTEHAIKLLRPELVADAQAVTRLYATLNAVAQLAHPGIAAADDALSADGWLALRSRLVLGESLRTLLSRQGALPPPRAASLIAQVCDTLAAAHAVGIAHGDLHPMNVLIASSGSIPNTASVAAPTTVLPAVLPASASTPASAPIPTLAEAILTDFGMAALVNGAAARGVPAAGAALTAPPPEYRAPEADAAQSDSAPADVYAAGVLLYECLAGRVPFTAQRPDAVAQMHRQSAPPPIAAIPDSLWRIVAACLEKDPRYRPTAAQLADALRAEAATPPTSAATPLPVPTPLSMPAPPTPAPTPAPVPDAAPTMIFDSYFTEDESLSDAPRPRPHSAPGSTRLPRVITEHKTESGIAAAVLVVCLLIGAALSMGAGNGTQNGGSPNAAAQATSAPTLATASAEPQAVVLPSASLSPSASPSPSSSPSPSASAPTGEAVFVNALSNKCMDTAGRAFANGTAEDIYDCNGTPAQSWTLTQSGQLTEAGGAYCLDDLNFGNTPGAKIGLWSCNGGTNQQWTLRPDGSIVSNYANLCLDVTGQGSDDFTPLVLDTCDGSPSQRWTRQ